MAVSKVAYDGHTLIDLTQDTAVESDVADGKYFHKSNGERVQGTSGKVIVQGSDSSAFLIRPTAGALAPLDCDRKSVLKKLGNTVCVNQLAKFEAANIPSARNSLTFSYTDGKSYKINGTADATGSASGWFNLSEADGLAGKAGHKLLCIPRLISGAITGNANHGLVGVAGHPFLSAFIDTAVEAGGQIRYSIGWESGTVFNDAIVTFEFHDIDLWFGSNDRIPSDLLSHPENWGRYYAGSLDYEPGRLENADGSILTSIHRNAWDEETEIGTIDIYGQNATYAYELRTKNYIPVIPNTEYFFKKSGNSQLFYYDSNKTFISYKNTSANSTFTTPPNCFFVRFRCGDAYGTTYKNDITISLYYPGESGYDQYYPYSVLAEVDTGSEVLLGNGDDDADTKLPDGTITRKWTTDTIAVASIYERATNPNCDFAVFAVSTAFASDVALDCRFSKYGTMNSSAHGWDAAVLGEPRIYQSPYQIAVAVPKGTTLAQAQALLDGATFMYRVVTPTTEQGTAFTGLQKVDGHGTEMVTGGTTGIPVPFVAQYLKTINAAPTDTIVITENGSHDVAMYAGAIVDVSGGGTPSLQSKTVNLDSNAPSTVYPGTGYNGLSSVSFNTAGINAADIKSGTSVCGVNGTCTATFDHNVTLSIKYDNDTGKTMYVYYMDKDSSDITKVVWKSQTVAADGAAHSITFPVSAYPVVGGAIRPIIYVQGWDGAAYSDIATKTGLEWCGVVHDDSASTGSEYFVFGVKANSVTLVIENNT